MYIILFFILRVRKQKHTSLSIRTDDEQIHLINPNKEDEDDSVDEGQLSIGRGSKIINTCNECVINTN